MLDTRRTFISVFVAALFVSSGVYAAGHEQLLRRVSTTAAALNPSAGESMALHVSLRRGAPLDVAVLDRDGFPVRHFPPKNGAAGDNAFVWDGKNDRGEIVADEAYSFRVVAAHGADEYFPAEREKAMVSIEPLAYSRATATLSYLLPVAARVHVQAGTVLQPGQGPVLKTVVDRQPRGAGKVAEHWSGFDESGSIYVPDLQGFAIAIAATPLPENSVITFGNHRQSFIEYASRRSGQSLLHRRVHAHHHGGLDVFNDVAPRLSIEPLEASYRQQERLWSVAGPALRLRVSANGPTAGQFQRHPGKIFCFAGSRLLSKRNAAEGAQVLELPVAEGEQIIAVNWVSDYGPVAVAVMKVRRDGQGRTVQRGTH